MANSEKIYIYEFVKSEGNCWSTSINSLLLFLNILIKNLFKFNLWRITFVGFKIKLKKWNQESHQKRGVRHTLYGIKQQRQLSFYGTPNENLEKETIGSYSL